MGLIKKVEIGRNADHGGNSTIKYSVLLLVLILFNQCTPYIEKQITGKVWVIKECLYIDKVNNDTSSLLPHLKLNTFVFNSDKSCRHPSWNRENCEWSLLNNGDSLIITSTNNPISGIFKIRLSHDLENNILELYLVSKNVYIKCVKL